MASDPGARRAGIELLAAPLLFVASITVWAVSDRLVYVGPFDRAQVGWAVAVPLFLLAPVAAGLAARSVGTRLAMAVAATIAAAIAALVILGLSATAQIGCEQVTRAEAAARALPVAMTAAGGFLAAVGTTIAARPRGTAVAVTAGILAGIAGGVTTLLVFALAYPGVSCAPAIPA